MENNKSILGSWQPEWLHLTMNLRQSSNSWKKQSIRWMLVGGWDTYRSATISRIAVRFIIENQYDERLQVAILSGSVITLVVNTKQHEFSDPMVNIKTHGHTIEVRLGYPKNHVADDQFLRVSLDGSFLDEPSLDDVPSRAATYDDLLGCLYFLLSLPSLFI